eukprot:gene9764-11994_t
MHFIFEGCCAKFLSSWDRAWAGCCKHPAEAPMRETQAPSGAFFISKPYAKRKHLLEGREPQNTREEIDDRRQAG